MVIPNTILPNFLVVGATKSGSSSLYHYLKQHPDIYLPEIKEPLFFINEIIEGLNNNDIAIKNENLINHLPKTIDDYILLFKKSKYFHKAIGECSASYLYYHKSSIPNIKKTLGDCKIIILLRHPVDKAFSQYKHLRRLGAEVNSFNKALKLEEKRIRENFSALYHYRNQGLYSNQVKAFYDNFNNVKVILTDDLQNSPKIVMNEIFSFLKVDSKINLDLSKKYNVTKFIPRNFYIHKLIYRSSLFSLIRRSSAFDLIRPKLKQKYYKINSDKIPQLTSSDRSYLLNTFNNDIKKLQELIKRDLTEWEPKY